MLNTQKFNLPIVIHSTSLLSNDSLPNPLLFDCCNSPGDNKPSAIKQSNWESHEKILQFSPCYDRASGLWPDIPPCVPVDILKICNTLTAAHIGPLFFAWTVNTSCLLEVTLGANSESRSFPVLMTLLDLDTWDCWDFIHHSLRLCAGVWEWEKSDGHWSTF